MIVVGGDDYKIFCGAAVSLLLRLMSENEDVNVKEFGHSVEGGLAVIAAPG